MVLLLFYFFKVAKSNYDALRMAAEPLCGGECQLVIAKTRLAPLKPGFTIPRLELMAALVGVRLMCFVKETVNVSTSQVTYWTDSMDVLYWIKSNKPLKVFVGNRVSDILKQSLPGQWYLPRLYGAEPSRPGDERCPAREPHNRSRMVDGSKIPGTRSDPG